MQCLSGSPNRSPTRKKHTKPKKELHWRVQVNPKTHNPLNRILGTDACEGVVLERSRTWGLGFRVAFLAVPGPLE